MMTTDGKARRGLSFSLHSVKSFFAADIFCYDQKEPETETTMDGSNGDAAAGGPNPAGGDGPGQGGVALLSDPVDVIIDKLLR